MTLGLRYALREPVRFALTAGGLACAVTLTVFLAGVYRGAVHGSLDYIAQADADVWVGSRGSWNLMRASGVLRGSVRQRILAVDGVRAAEPILAALVPAEVRGERRTLLVIGLDGNAPAARPRTLVTGVAVPREEEIIIDRAFARRMHVWLGDEIELAGHTARIAGISTGTNLLVTQYAFASRKQLLRRVGVADRATFFLVKTEPDQATAVAAALESSIPGIAAFDHATFLANNRQEIEAGFLPVLWAVAALGLAVGVVVVALMSYTAVLEKRGDFAVLSALGARHATRFGVVLQQALTAALVGGVIGLAVLLGLQHALPALVPEVEFRLDPGIAAAALAGAAGMATLGALLPARLALRLSPMEAFRR
ncbi:MAG: FtsX-like permease family protein [Gemmatimonadales bacterium]|nr:FtsX-like permease family protein [Gemmatimonadales bacterium]NIN11176.1 FtsX-like permease family protein [Gemmatimonadales bacterium]NIN49775.1 FtsX-like permease family protein [Gemmatimonadales bacterium]NIP07239.1 FtsX-like permease family protein [Gemmatimonadales bacterium]NIR00452.1 FtsX-like permease family protein [Gemmatimonadales bacterium]